MSELVSGAYTSKGFVSFEKNYFTPDCFTYIMKGYPNSVKTLFLNKIIEEKQCGFVQYDYRNQPYLVYCENKNICIKDGTYPYSADVKTYGVCDKIIDMSAYQKDDELKKQAVRVNDLMTLIKKEEQRCERFLLSCGAIFNDCKRLEKNNTDIKKLNRYASKLWHRYGNKLNGRVGLEHKFFATVINETGIVRNDGAFNRLCNNVIAVNDWSGYAADLIIDKIRLYALSSGYDVIACMDILAPNDIPEHIIIPELKFGIYRERGGHLPEFKAYKRVHAKRFMLKEINDTVKNRVSFSKKAYADLINEAVSSVKKIKFYNDELDSIYIKSFDNDKFFNGLSGLV